MCILKQCLANKTQSLDFVIMLFSCIFRAYSVTRGLSQQRTHNKMWGHYRTNQWFLVANDLWFGNNPGVICQWPIFTKEVNQSLTKPPFNGSWVKRGLTPIVKNRSFVFQFAGFLTTGDDRLPGNYGLLDQVAALRWLAKNLPYFHGNPDRVTVFGSSAGASSIGFLMLSPLSKGKLCFSSHNK